MRKIVDENLQILWQRFHALDVNNPKFFTRCYQLVKTIYMCKNDEAVVKELDRLYFDYPPFHIPVSYLEDAFFASIGGSMGTNIQVNSMKASVMDINLHLNIFYGYLLYLATVALFEAPANWGIDFAGSSLQTKPRKQKQVIEENEQESEQ